MNVECHHGVSLDVLIDLASFMCDVSLEIRGGKRWFQSDRSMQLRVKLIPYLKYCTA